MRRLILRSSLPPGDILMLTAAVRDLHRAYPRSFLTDVRTHHPDLWEGNPYITRLEPSQSTDVIDCHYPLIQECNVAPYHFIHGFIAFLNEQLGLQIRATEFKGDLHLSKQEELEPLFPELIDTDLPLWLVCSGGKRDFTIKWWDVKRYQQVVDHFSGRIRFIQVGASGDYHPELEGVVDLRGMTDLRTLIKLVHRADGVISPVSLLMHLAAAVPTASNRLRPCVVVAGGREPVHWEAYPGHQFLHTIGMLACCQSGGCWRSRTVPLPDDSTLNRTEHLCIDVVNQLPRCMDMIQAEDVIEQVERYLTRHNHLQRLQQNEARKLAINGLDDTRLNASQYDNISRAALHAVRGQQSDEDRIISFYRNVNATLKPPAPDFRTTILTNTPQGLGDTLLLTSLLKAAADQNTLRYVQSDSSYFPILMKYNPYYTKPPVTIADRAAADVLQRKYDMGNGHFIQRLQRVFGLKPDLKPRGFLEVSGERISGRVALHFEAGDSHAAWQRIYVHPRARQLYPESRVLIQRFINEHPELTFLQFGRKPIPLDNVRNCTGLPLAESIEQLNTCEYFIGIVSGPMHLSTALGLKCIVILNFPRPEEIYLPALKDINLIESEWLYPQNVHLHQEGEGPLVKRLTLDNLERAMSGQIYPYWSDQYLALIHERL